MATIRQNIQVLTDVSNTTQERIAGIETALDQAAIGVVQNDNRGTQDPGFVVFVGRSHRVRSPTPTPSDREG